MTIATIVGMANSASRDSAPFRHGGDEPHLLREIVRTHQVLVNGFSRQVGVPASRFALMRLLAKADEGIGVMALARALGVNAAAVTRQVQEMEREGLVERHADPNDGRRSSLSLSPKGIELFARVHDRGHQLERSLVSVIGAEEMAAATAVLSRLRRYIEGLEREEGGLQP